jgi:hypothetical protein
MDGSRVVESEGGRLSVGWSRVVEFDERDGGFGESRVKEFACERLGWEDQEWRTRRDGSKE